MNHLSKNNFGYIDDSLDPTSLGFLIICLGGSRAYSLTSSATADWDGIGIVSRRQEIIQMVTLHKSALSRLLWIEEEECPSWAGIECEDNWDVLRFSGRAKDGTKRTIKIWSLESLFATSLSSELCRIGVLSSRCVRSFPRYHPDEGHTLYLYHPTYLASGLSILEDVDFMLSDLESSPSSRAYPAVTCDLFLTSIPIFTISQDLVDMTKTHILLKWSKISENFTPESCMFYGSNAFTPSYYQDLLRDLRSLVGSLESQSKEHKVLVPAEFSIASPQKALFFMIYRDFSGGVQHAGQYTTLCFIGKPHNSIPPSDFKLTKLLTFGFTLNKQIPAQVGLPFSSNSSTFYAQLQLGDVQEWKEVFVKYGPGVALEMDIYPTLKVHFSAPLLQNILAYDENRGYLVFEKFPGKLLNEIRLELHNGIGPTLLQDDRMALKWLAEVELFRSQQVVKVQLSTLSATSVPSKPHQQAIHRFYHDRLYQNHRFLQFYGNACPSFMKTEKNRALTLDKFMSLPLIINGAEHLSLERCFRQAEAILDPFGHHLYGTSSALGLGDGHGGNIMVKTNDFSALRFIDYEVAGHHNPILDQAKPLYLDGFFPVMYKDLLKKRNTAPTDTETNIQWCVTEDAITINFDIRFGIVDRVLAYIKLKWILRPILEQLAEKMPSELETSEELLSAALFTNALLTRNFFTLPPETFFLNCAVGILLMSDLRLSLKTFFGWDLWPQAVNNSHSEPNSEHLAHDFSKSMTLSQKGASQLEPLLNQEDMWPTLLNAILNQTLGVDNLKPEIVYLKRFEDTLRLHKRFSQDQAESSDVIITRINNAREMGMQIAPHTCIRECIFAEPRIDRHFLYQKVLEEGSVSKRLIDVGCCMGSDIRKLILDGFKAKNILGLDLEEGFYGVGKMLYNERSQSRPFGFRQADVLAENFYKDNADLESAFDFVHSANVIHLFNSLQQSDFVRAMAFLVKPNGYLWGRQVGLIEDENMEAYRQPSGKGVRFTASEFKALILDATGWAEDEVIYKSETVKYTELRAMRKDKNWTLQWFLRAPAEKKRNINRFTVVL